MSIKAGKVWGQTELVHANGVLEFHRIEFNKGYACSEHKHDFKWNGFFVESGEMVNGLLRIALERIVQVTKAQQIEIK